MEFPDSLRLGLNTWKDGTHDVSWQVMMKVMLELPTRRVPQQGFGELGPASTVIDHFVGICCGLT
jgi:hypothetical protein